MGGLVLHPAPRASFTLDQGGEATFTITDEQGGQLVIAASNAKMVMPASTQATMAIVSESLQGPAGGVGAIGDIDLGTFN